MQYLGSKNRIAKDLKPIIESYIDENTTWYIEPFVGGANMIDKIDFKNKIGIDINPYLIDLLKYTSNFNNKLPKTISEEDYYKVKDNKDRYDKWYVGLVGFCSSYSAKFFAGYSGGTIGKGKDNRDRTAEAIRNLEKQRHNLEGIKFYNKHYEECSNVKGAVIYCDIPYKGTTKYATDSFDYDKFYDWCVIMSEHNTVLISEYEMPEDRFEAIWEKEHNVNLDSKMEFKSKRVEKLFKVKTASER